MADTLVLVETGGTGDCWIPGKSGERGCFQFMPGTYYALAEEYIGRFGLWYPAHDELPRYPHIERYLALKEIQKYLDLGRDAMGVALRWNAGPNARACSKGTNSYGVKYNSCGYLDTFALHYQRVTSN